LCHGVDSLNSTYAPSASPTRFTLSSTISSLESCYSPKKAAVAQLGNMSPAVPTGSTCSLALAGVSPTSHPCTPSRAVALSGGCALPSPTRETATPTAGTAKAWSSTTSLGSAVSVASPRVVACGTSPLSTLTMPTTPAPAPARSPCHRAYAISPAPHVNRIMCSSGRW
jgi:hypothetical protein